MPMTSSETAAIAAGKYQETTLLLGVWVFLLSESMLFGGLILGHLTYYYLYSAGYAEASSHTKLLLGGVNTFVLLSSSAAMAIAVKAAHEGNRRFAGRLLLVVAGLGAIFLAIKGTEYFLEYREGLFPWGSFTLPGAAQKLFFVSYFILTGFHAAHVTIGILAVFALAYFVVRRNASSAAVSAIGLYWHFVDVVWVILFPLLYLGGRFR